jgi:anti-anti-sigma factor
MGKQARPMSSGVPRLVVEDRGGITAAYFAGRNVCLGLIPATGTVEQLSKLAEGTTGGTLILSLDGVVFLDSSALGKFVGLQKRLKAAGGKFIICDMTAEVLDSFVQTGLDKFLDLRPRESLDKLAPPLR